MPAPAEIYATVDAFLAGLAAAGVGHVVLSPGLRSTPLAVPVRLRDDLTTEMVLDERTAAFIALGRAKATRRPVGVICTSGTAGANYYPAVIEADLTRVPLVVITADRPHELQGWDAGQTIDQIHLYGRHAKDFVEMPAGTLAPRRAERIGFRAGVTAQTPPPGPVHVNWPFREPLEPPEEWLEGRTPAVSRLRWQPPAPSPTDLKALQSVAGVERGVIVAGPMDASPAVVAGVGRLSAATGWPIIADPLSQLRSHAGAGLVVDAADHLLKTERAARLSPEVVVRVGATPTSKACRLWLEASAPPHVLMFDAEQRWPDPSALFSVLPAADPACLAEVDWGPQRSTSWSEEWRRLNQAVRHTVDEIVEGQGLLELGAAACVARAAPDDSALVVASSMPVRDLDMVMKAGESGLRVFANRGANGIDGTTSTALGIAQAAGATTLLTGDLAFLHDIGGMVAAAQRRIDLTVVVLNNGGGGIFGLLPIAELGERIHFEELYLTPQTAGLEHVARAFDVGYELVTDPARLEELVARPGGLRIVEVPIDRQAGIAQIRQIGEAVEDAVR